MASGARRYQFALRRKVASEPAVDWHAKPPVGHRSGLAALPDEERRLERERSGQQLLRGRSFRTPCAKNQLTLCIHMPTPAEAKSLMPEAEALSSDMHGMEVLLLQQFVEKDYGDDLLLLTASEEPSGHLVGMIFWRYLRKAEDEHWAQVNIDWQAALGPKAGESLVSGRPLADAFTLIELLCTDETYRGHGVGKLLLGAALAYSSVKDGRTAAVLTLGHGDENRAARDLYEKVGFEEMPEEYFSTGSEAGSPASASGSLVEPRHVMVVWDIEHSLKSLTLGDLLGSKKGIVVPQLGEMGATKSEKAAQEHRHLDCSTSADLVQRLTGSHGGGPGACGAAAAAPVS